MPQTIRADSADRIASMQGTVSAENGGIRPMNLGSSMAPERCCAGWTGATIL